MRQINVADENAPFIIESGYEFTHAEVAYESYGILNETRSNVVLLLHGLSGSSHGASHSKEDVRGWWEPLIGKGKVLDTDRYFVLVPNILGSCYGTLGPQSMNPRTQKRYGASFPEITVRDMVALHRRLLDALGVVEPLWVIGGSLGGMQAMEWGVLFGEGGSGIISIVAPEKMSAQGIGFNYLMRQAIYNDPHWENGNYDISSGPLQGLSIARGIGMMTYQTEFSMEKKFGRAKRNNEWEIGNYLAHHGKKMVAVFDAHCYLRLINSMDSHDLNRGRENYLQSIQKKRGKVVFIGDDSDLLYGIEHQSHLAEKWKNAGVDAVCHDLATSSGHDSFLSNFDELSKILVKYL